jgi:hypothetical protein
VVAIRGFDKNDKTGCDKKFSKSNINMKLRQRFQFGTAQWLRVRFLRKFINSNAVLMPGQAKKNS